MLLARLAGIGALLLVTFPVVLFDDVLAGAIAVLVAMIPAARGLRGRRHSIRRERKISSDLELSVPVHPGPEDPRQRAGGQNE